MSLCFTKEQTPSLINSSHDAFFDSMSTIESSDEDSVTDESEVDDFAALTRKMTRFGLECVMNFVEHHLK